jgi:hypothetical protein
MTQKDTIKNATVCAAGRLRMMWEKDRIYTDQDRAYIHTCLQRILNCVDCQVESGCLLRAIWNWVKGFFVNPEKRRG